MPQFNVGDIVVSLVDHPDGNTQIIKGSTGEVCCVMNRRVGVRWDIDSSRWPFHDCDGYCKSGYGWYVLAHELELLTIEMDKSFESNLMELIGVIM